MWWKKKEPVKLEMEPFGKLEFDYFWEGQVVLSSWANFHWRGGEHHAGNAAGKVVVSISGDEKVPPRKEQVAAFAYLKEHEVEIAKTVLGAIFNEYPRLREELADFADEECMPEIKRPEELKTLIGLGTVHVLDVAKDGVAYVGFDFECKWDDEHGLGVMTQGNRVVIVGAASDSFEEWRAEEDGGTKIA